MRLELDETAAAPAPPAPALDRTVTQVAGSAPAAPATEGLAAGQQLGHFRVERLLGAGGMGEVYLATDLALDRPVAIKVLPEALARDATRRERLIREARAQARVVHANVGHIYYIGEERGLLFVAMEYVPGETLAQRAAAAPLPIDDALAAIRGAALGLREAHRAGFLHRDVKPSNLMLDAHGAVKVLDFGLAAGGGAREEVDAGPIAQTSLVGTPLYMAPEQARGEPIDVRADIYALGATLFHLVSGKPPFEGKSADELRTLHASAPRPRVPATLQPRTADALGELCARMMAAEPADRFASYDDLLAALDTFATSRARPAGFSVRLTAALIDLLLVALVVSGAVAAIGLLLEVRNVHAGAAIFAGLVLYETVCVRRWGRTAGKAALELEVVSAARGERPSWAQALRRGLGLFALPLVLDLSGSALAAAGLPTWPTEALETATYIGVVVLLGWASARTHGRRAPWDRMSGTLVRYRGPAAR